MAFITFWALLGSLILHSALLHFTIIHLSGVQEYREGAIVDTTHLLMRGENPYSLNNLPTHTNVYGLTLSAIMAGLSPLLDPSLVNHRIVSGICILLSCMVLASIAHKSGLSYRDSLFCGVFYYVLINLSYSILARPDGIGLLVMFLCVRLAMVDPRHRFGWMALAVSILLGCLAYFTKPYLFYGAGCAAVYIGWHRSLKLAVIYWMALVFALVAMIGMAKVMWPMYWYSTFEIHKLANTPSAGHFWSQWAYFSLTHSGWALAIAFILPGFLRQFPRKNIFSQSFYSGIWSQGFGSRMGGHWAGFCVAVSIIILSVSLAWHQGAYLIYFLHILSPFFLISGFLSLRNRSIFIKRTGHRLPLGYALAFFQFVILNAVVRPLPVMDFDHYMAWTDLLKPDLKVLASPLMVPEMLDRHIEFPDNGQAEYLLAFSINYTNSTPPEVSARSIEFITDLRNKISTGYYDRILMVPKFFSVHFHGVSFGDHYEKKADGMHFAYYGEFVKPWKYGNSYYPLELWERKKSDRLHPQLTIAP